MKFIYIYYICVCVCCTIFNIIKINLLTVLFHSYAFESISSKRDNAFQSREHFLSIQYRCSYKIKYQILVLNLS